MKIGFIGLGKLGKPVAEEIAKEYTVIGYDTADVDIERVDVKKSIADVCKGTDIIFIAVPTPHHKDYDGSQPTSHLEVKDFDYSVVESVLAEVEKYTKKGQIVSLISTVLPGTTRKLAQTLTKATLLYNPYLIAMSTVKNDFRDPEMIIIGQEDSSADWAAEKLKQFYEPLVVLDTRYETGTWEEAESIKIFYNTWISAKISISNTVQDVAEGLGNINVDKVTDALSRSNMRIVSSAYMRAGVGDGGPCHPRDNIALSYLANQLNLGYDLFQDVMKTREQQARNKAMWLVQQNMPIVILGTRYKKGTLLEDGSYSLLVGWYAEKEGGSVTYYDPELRPNQLPEKPAAFFISFWEDWIKHLGLPQGSVALDPWRTTNTFEGVMMKRWGNTH